MKTINKLFILLAITLSSCTVPAPKLVQVTILADVSDDHHIQHIDEDVICQFYGFQETPWTGACYRLDLISDIPYNSTATEIRLPAGNPVWGNVKQRRDEISQFEHDLRASLHALDSLNQERTRSNVFLSVSRELRRLAASSADEKHLLVFSDLLENTNHFSTLDDDQLRMMEAYPDSVLNMLSGSAPLPDDLTGISIQFIWVPEEYEEYEHFAVASNWYKTILEARGAEVGVSGKVTLPRREPISMIPAKPKITHAQTGVGVTTICDGGDCEDETGTSVTGIDYDDSTTGQVGGGAINIDETGGFTELESPDLSKALDDLLSNSDDRYIVRMALIASFSLFVFAVAVNMLIQLSDSVATRLFRFIKVALGPSDRKEEKDEK